MANPKHIKVIISYESNGIKGHNGMFPSLYETKSRFYKYGITSENTIELEVNNQMMNKGQIIQFFEVLDVARKPRNLTVVSNRTNHPPLSGLQQIIRSAGLDEKEWEVTKNSLTKVKVTNVNTGELKEIAV